jgi:hypothetical protein
VTPDVTPDVTLGSSWNPFNLYNFRIPPALTGRGVTIHYNDDSHFAPGNSGFIPVPDLQVQQSGLQHNCSGEQKKCLGLDHPLIAAPKTGNSRG